MKPHFFTFICLINTLIEVCAQDIKGKWMQVRMPNTISYPVVNIIEITNDSIYSFDFNKLNNKGKIDIDKNNKLILNDSIKVNYRFCGKNVFEQIVGEQNNAGNPPIGFVRLLPSIDKNNLVDSLENKFYSIHFPSGQVPLKLGERLPLDDFIILDNLQTVIDYSCVERISNTFFLCFYNANVRSYAFPIKEINNDGFFIYGIYNVNGEVMVKRE